MCTAPALAGVLLLAAVSPARAQDAAASLADLQSAVKPGDTVTVTTRDGREVRGRVLTLSASVLEVAHAGAPAVFRDADISLISRRDSPWNGMLWGLAAGIAAGALAERSIVDYYEEHGDGVSSDGSFTVGAGLAGAAIGFAVDWLIKGRRVVYRAPSGRASFTADTRGVRFSLRW